MKEWKEKNENNNKTLSLFDDAFKFTYLQHAVFRLKDALLLIGIQSFSHV